MNDFPFNIKDVAKLCGINTNKEDSSEYVDCPFCGRKKKLNLNYNKNQFRCPACNTGGSMLKLYSLCNGFNGSNAEITEAIKKELGVESTPYTINQNRKINEPNKDDLNVDFERMEKWDKVYRALLRKLNIGSLHIKKLKEDRFMDDADIQRFMFKSVPLMSYKRICSELISEGFNLEGVGGFYFDQESNTWNIAMNPKITGYIIPVWNFFGKIEGLQIRLDKPFSGYKYHLISSSDYFRGTKTPAVPFFVKGEHPRKANTLVVTEGFFKAAIPNKIFGCDVMALFGVNNQKEFKRLIPYIKERGYTTIVEAFDADFRYNENVANAKKLFAELVQENGFEFKEFKWDISMGKGFDDYSLYTLSH